MPPRLVLLALLGLGLFADAAHAQSLYSLTGRWAHSRGFLAQLPLFGAAPCPSLMLGWKTTTGEPIEAAAAPNGCIPSDGVAIVTSGGAFDVPPNAFAQPLPTDGERVVTGASPSIVAVQTSLAFSGPPATPLHPAGSMATGGNTARFRAFRASAWTQQSGRVGADFTWCVGAPECTNVQSGTQPLLVKYSAGPNRFGGAMGLVVAAGSNRSLQIRGPGSAGTGSGPYSFLPLVTTGPRPTGRGYAVRRTDASALGSAWAMIMSSPGGRITMGTTYLGPRPVQAVQRVGFPFTTGRVLVRNGGTVLGNPRMTSFIASGNDSVTAMGARNLSLVAGALASPLGVGFGSHAATLDLVSLPEPSASAGGRAGVLGLLAIAALRRRRSRSDASARLRGRF